MKFRIKFLTVKDEGIIEVYFNPDGPTRSATFFLENHCKIIGDTLGDLVPEVGEPIIFNNHEYVTLGRVYDYDESVVNIILGVMVEESEAESQS